MPRAGWRADGVLYFHEIGIKWRTRLRIVAGRLMANDLETNGGDVKDLINF